MTAPILSVDRLSHSYYANGAWAIEEVSLTLRPGQVMGIVGRNGAGKSTLLNTLQGHRVANTGSIALDGEDVTHLPVAKRARRGLGLVQQGRPVFSHLTARDNLIMGLEARRDGRRTIPQAITDTFAIFKDNPALLRRTAGNLSGGEQQQLLINRALAGDPKVLLLDEPTEGVERKVVSTIGQLLRFLARRAESQPAVADGLSRPENLGMIIVEQNLPFICEYADDDCVFGMSRGRLVGPLPKSELASFLSHA